MYLNTWQVLVHYILKCECRPWNGTFVENMLQLHGLALSKIKHKHYKFSKTVMFYTSTFSIGTVQLQKDTNISTLWPKLAEMTRNATLSPYFWMLPKKNKNSTTDFLQLKITLNYNTADIYSSVSSLSLSEASSHVGLSSFSCETFAQFWHRHKSVQDSLADIQEHLPVSHLLCLQLQWTACNTLSGAGFLVIQVTVNSPSSRCHPLPTGEGAHIIPFRECLIMAAW